MMLAALASALLCGGLDKEIRVDFFRTPFSEAVELIREKSGLTIAVEKAKLGEILHAPITLRAKSIPVREALAWVTRLAGASFEASGKTITVSTLESLLCERVELELHDVRDIARSVPSFPGPTYAVIEATTPPRRGEWNPDSMETCPSYFDSLGVGSLAEIVQTRIRPETWAPELGTSIEERSGKLVVMQTPEVHAEIERLIQEYRREAMRMVSITVEEMIVPEREVAGVVRKSGCSLVDHGAAQELRKKATATRAASLLCFNGQRTHSHGGSNRSFLADFDASDAALDPVMLKLNAGISVDVLPRISGDGRCVLLDFHVESCEEPEMLTFEYLECHAAAGADRPVLVPGSVETPRRGLTLFRSSFKLPLGKTAILFAGDGTRVFLVSAQVVQP